MSQGKDDEDTGSWNPPERQLRTDGRMTGDLPIAPPAEPDFPPPPSTRDGLPTLEALTTGELQLARPKSIPPSYVEQGSYRMPVAERRPWKWVAVLLALGLGVLALFALKPGLQRQLPIPEGRKGTVMIFSDPDGATVKIGNVVVGVTPFATDNIWNGETSFELIAPGRQSRSGTFNGGSNFKTTIVLPKAKR